MLNTLYYGDNLPVLREHLDDESADLIYLDPPFNSNASYNVLFKEQSGEESPAQIRAFTDTWQWTQETERAYEQEIILNSDIPANVKDMVSAFRQFIGRNRMMAYLVMMTPRLVELRRVLKPTGSIYLHCDPTASHYLKILMDTLFGVRNFRNEITWQRTESHNTAGRYGNIADILLFYTKSDHPVWNRGFHKYARGETQYSEQQMKRFRYIDEDGRRYRLDDLTAPQPNSDSGNFEWRGTIPGPTRGWGYKIEQLEEWWTNGRIRTKRDGTPRMDGLKVYLDESEGNPLQNIWHDVPRIPNTSSERLGYPTQKPLALLDRIIQVSSNEGEVVLDPFCGCGTTVEAAENLERRWIGIDITHLAVATMKNRIKTAFDLLPGKDYQVIGEPVDVGSARALAEQDRYQFQYWAVSLLEAAPVDQTKKGADKGIDGVVHFIDGQRRSTKKAVVQVKSGKVSSPHIRDLKGTVEREKAAMGLFITLEEPTSAMSAEAVSAGFYYSNLWQRDYPKIQIRTIADLLEGRNFDLPPHPSMYQPAQRVQRSEGLQTTLGDASS